MQRLNEPTYCGRGEPFYEQAAIAAEDGIHYHLPLRRRTVSAIVDIDVGLLDRRMLIKDMQLLAGVTQEMIRDPECGR